jgi:hypothetical protein
LPALLGAALLLPGWAGSQPAEINQERLEVIEDLSESLANDMLDLSVAVRDRDLAGMAVFVPQTLRSNGLQWRPGSLSRKVKWIAERRWRPRGDGETGLTRKPRERFLNEWEALLGHFSELEDARFKVKEAQFDEGATRVVGAQTPTAAPGASGRARLAFFVLGRNREGQREWARGTALADVRMPAQGPWRFESFELLGLESMVAVDDLFSEVSVPATVAREGPASGAAADVGFIWHGAAAGDLDRDGWLDLFVTGPDRSRVYLNDGDGRFREAGTETGAALLASGVAPLLLDYDNDGDLDAFLSEVGPQVLLENRLVPDGKLSFTDISLEAGVHVPAVGFSAAAADVNADGRPDVYVCSYNFYGRVTPDSWFRATNGTPNLLFVSQPDGTFREQAARWGVADRRWSYAAAFADVNEDGRPDLYVANDFGEKALFVHKGDRFVDEARERGVLDPGNGMGAAFGDYNNDGRLDLHVTNMSSTAGNRIVGRLFPGARPDENVLKKLASGNSLYENVGGGRFRDVTEQVGGFLGGWAWGGGFIDFDNDGREDLYTPSGFISGKSMRDT